MGAKVTLTNPQTSVTRNTTTGKDGAYEFNLIPIGSYELTIEQPGFREHTSAGASRSKSIRTRSSMLLYISVRPAKSSKSRAM